MDADGQRALFWILAPVTIPLTIGMYVDKTFKITEKRKEKALRKERNDPAQYEVGYNAAKQLHKNHNTYLTLAVLQESERSEDSFYLRGFRTYCAEHKEEYGRHKGLQEAFERIVI